LPIVRSIIRAAAIVSVVGIVSTATMFSAFLNVLTVICLTRAVTSVCGNTNTGHHRGTEHNHE
jgi:hypothetical protein